MVVTGEYWEVNKVLSSRSAIEAMASPRCSSAGFTSNRTIASLLRFPSCAALVVSPPARPSRPSGLCASLLRAFTGVEVLTARTLRAQPKSGALILWCGQSS